LHLAPDLHAGPAGQEVLAALDPSKSSSKGEKQTGPNNADADNTFMSAVRLLVDDMNTPAALSTLSAPLKAINDLLTTKAGKKNPNR